MRGASAGEPLLAVRDLTMRFSGITALDHLSFDVRAGTVTSLIGPNGAGKSTCLNCVSGVYRPTSGAIRLHAKSLLRRPPHTIVAAGVARTFQHVELFAGLSVLENVLVGADAGAARGIPASGHHSRAGGARRSGVRAITDYLGLTHLEHRSVGALPFGTRKMVELARALAARPQLLLLDEPAAGLNHEEAARLVQTIKRIRDDFDVTILLIEHQMPVVMHASDHVVVLNFGRKLAEGGPETIRRDPAVVEAYLGVA